MLIRLIGVVTIVGLVLAHATECRAAPPPGPPDAGGAAQGKTTAAPAAPATTGKAGARAPAAAKSLWDRNQNGSRRLISGHELELPVPDDGALLAVARVELAFGALTDEGRAAPQCDSKGMNLEPFQRTRDDKSYVAIRIPEFERIAVRLSPRYWEGMVWSYPGLLCFRDGEGVLLADLPVEVAEPAWAFRWATAVVLLMWAGFGILLRRQGSRLPWWNPLGLVVDRTGRYSLSLLQSLVWTYVTAFGIVFVWKITETFLDITPQVLILLGIGGSTALLTNAQKLARWRDIPERFRALLQSDTRPRLSDLVTEDGTPSVPKAQMLIFTILISFTVVKQIWETYVFPSLSDGLVTLMGISSALYVGNTVQRADTLETVQVKMRAMDDKLVQLSLSRTPGAVPPSMDEPKAEAERSDLLRALRNYLM